MHEKHIKVVTTKDIGFCVGFVLLLAAISMPWFVGLYMMIRWLF